MKLRLLLGLIFISICSFTNEDVKNYLGTADVLNYNGISYKLVASYHPNNIYYKQEYIPAGQSADHYNTMLIVDFYITDAASKALLEIKEKELSTRKKTDPVVNFERFENPQSGEYMLDFTLSDSNGDKLNTVERNVYRYKNQTDKSGKKGILLFGLSQRGYGNDISNFFDRVKTNRINDINSVAGYSLPSLDIK